MSVASRGWNHGADAFIQGFETLRQHGVRLGRCEQWVRLTHPLLTGGRLLWKLGTGGQWAVEVGGSYVVEDAAERIVGDNPFHRERLRPLDERWLLDRLSPGALEVARDPHAVFEAPRPVPEVGHPGAVLCVSDFGSSERALLLLVPDADDSFTPDELCRLHTFAWAMSTVGRLHRWRSLATVLARSYIGPQTGLRVLGGQLRRGDLERRHALVWFSDVRGFTELSARSSPEHVVDVLNAVFEALGREIAREGGEILKIIGDAVLAIFPYEDEAGAPSATKRALAAARAGLARLPDGVRVGVGLHRGELVYGNIGSPERLDFTVIGTTVNTASRIEGWTGKLGVPVLCSSAVAACIPALWERVGAFELKGLPGTTELFAPVSLGTGG
jgi:class 3 adenylate cyclase